MVLLVLLTLVLPNYPALHYYILEPLTLSNSDITIENSNTLIGDLRYLSAIAKRAEQVNKVDDEKRTTPPKPHKDISGVVYVVSNSNIDLTPHFKAVKYILLKESFTGRFVLMNSPPPKV